jgi:hypothetical protein
LRATSIAATFLLNRVWLAHPVIKKAPNPSCTGTPGHLGLNREFDAFIKVPVSVHEHSSIGQVEDEGVLRVRLLHGAKKRPSQVDRQLRFLSQPAVKETVATIRRPLFWLARLHEIRHDLVTSCLLRNDVPSLENERITGPIALPRPQDQLTANI